MAKSEKDLSLFARQLKTLREAAKMSQKELALRTGMHLGGIFKLEQGVNHPSWDSVQKLAHALGVSVTAFVDPAIVPQPVEVKRGRGRPRLDQSNTNPAPTARERKGKRS